MDNVKREGEILHQLLNSPAMNGVWNGKPFSKTYRPYANTTLKYLAGERKDYINPDYKDIDITYTFDENGYRKYPNYKPTSSKKVFTYGCSMTFGFSQPDEHTWPLLLANKLGNWQLSNYGTPGIGADEIARICYQSITSLSKEEYPDAVFVYLPDIFRTEYIGNQNKHIEHYAINLVSHKYPTLQSIKEAVLRETDSFKKSILHKAQLYYEYTNAIDSFLTTVNSFKLIKETLDSRNIPWFWHTWGHVFFPLKKNVITKFLGDNTLFEEDNLKILYYENSRGRDGSHMGLKYTDSLAELFLDLYKNYEKPNKQNS